MPGGTVAAMAIGEAGAASCPPSPLSSRRINCDSVSEFRRDEKSQRVYKMSSTKTIIIGGGQLGRMMCNLSYLHEPGLSPDPSQRIAWPLVWKYIIILTT